MSKSKHIGYPNWFVSRCKRKLVPILEALIAFSDSCVGKVWNKDLQQKYEDILGERGIIEHGNLRARKEGQGGGGGRTYFKLMKDLGLVFLEDDSRKCRLTLIGEELIRGDVSFVDAMRLQLQKYQYPSAASWSGSGRVDHRFNVHPFQFVFRLLRDPRLENTLTMDEMRGIVIHKALNDSDEVFEDIVQRILQYRRSPETYSEFIYEPLNKNGKNTKRYWNIANTFFNYTEVTQYTSRGEKTLHIREGKEADVDAFIEESPSFIQRPDLAENYQRRYGRGHSAMDRRNFDDEKAPSQKERNEARIRREYVLMALKTPITGITSDIVVQVSNSTGIDEITVERFLAKNYPHGNIDDFFLSYKELAHMGTSGARDFELATCEMFKKVFHMETRHVGPIGNSPDVLVLSEEAGFCGIIDNKAYKSNYGITGNHKRVMEDEYIPHYQEYGKTTLPLSFFCYIAESFNSKIDGQIQRIVSDTGVNGAAMPVDLLINLAQDCLEKDCPHEVIKKLFSVNRQVRLSDIEEINHG